MVAQLKLAADSNKSPGALVAEATCYCQQRDLSPRESHKKSETHLPFTALWQS